MRELGDFPLQKTKPNDNVFVYLTVISFLKKIENIPPSVRVSYLKIPIKLYANNFFWNYKIKHTTWQFISFLLFIALSLPDPLPSFFFWDSPGEKSRKPKCESLFLSNMTWFKMASTFPSLKISWNFISRVFPRFN